GFEPWRQCHPRRPEAGRLVRGLTCSSAPSLALWTASGLAGSVTLAFSTNADDRLPLASLGPIEGGDGVVEGRDDADVRPQSSVTPPRDDLTQRGAIGHENKVDRQAVGGPRLGRPGDGHQRSSGSN